VRKIKLGDWVCPSGNSCAVTFEQETSQVGHLWFAWDVPPPLTQQDTAHYRAVIIPAVLAKIQALGLKPSWSRPLRTGGVA